jgi:hypothetical protein
MATNYEDFNPNDPYAESNAFKPNICIDFANGNAWFGGGKHHFNKDGSGWLADKNIIIQANGDIMSNQLDKAYLTNSTNIYLPQVPYGYTKTILIPYLTTRSAPVLKFHVNGDRDRILFKDSMDSDKLKITTYGAVLSYIITGLGHGCLKLVGFDNGIDIVNCIWQLTNDFYGDPTVYNG